MAIICPEFKARLLVIAATMGIESYAFTPYRLSANGDRSNPSAGSPDLSGGGEDGDVPQ